MIEVDYLVVGAGAAGMAFTDALVEHADVSVLLVDRRHSVGGHWLDAYPFVRLHQSSAFYGVPSTLLGGGRVQQDGPEAGMHERATAPEVCAYYSRVLQDRLLASGKVTFRPGTEHVGDGRVVSRLSGKDLDVRARRVVDASFLAPRIPSRTPPPFEVDDGVEVIPVNALAKAERAPSQYVIVGSGKTATDSCVWLIDNGVDPDAIVWVRPRDPWMQNRALIQPDPALFIGTAAATMEAAAVATSPDDLFLRLEEIGAMLRIDRTVTPTMAKTPTLAQWELDRLRTIENVVRLGHVKRVEPGRLMLENGDVPITADALVVHCAASGLRLRPSVPIWGPSAITLQTVRAGFPCFGAALIGYIEATVADDAEKNRICPPSTYPDTTLSWTRMQLLGARGAMAFGSEAHVREWANTLALNPARVTPQDASSPAVSAAIEHFQRALPAGLEGLERLSA